MEFLYRVRTVLALLLQAILALYLCFAIIYGIRLDYTSADGAKLCATFGFNKRCGATE